jgi:hypothetical protein
MTSLPVYLYVYEPDRRGVVCHLHIYDRNTSLEVNEADVDVAWSVDLSKCGVVIWKKFRGIINISTGQEGRVWMETRQTPGIADKAWLPGFPLDVLCKFNGIDSVQMQID